MKLYKRHLKWTNEFVKNNISIIEKNYSLYPSRTQWNNMTVYDKESHKFVDIWEDVHSVHDYEMKDIYRIDYKFLRQQYTKVTADVTREYGLERYGISDIWYNYYKKGQYQIPHKHLGPYNDQPPGGLTAIHYMIFDPKVHSTTHFTDPNIKPLKVRAGDIVFFPDDLEHYVPKSETDKPRLTVAFTVSKH